MVGGKDAVFVFRLQRVTLCYVIFAGGLPRPEFVEGRKPSELFQE